MFGVFRVKNHDFTPKNHIFSNFRGGSTKLVTRSLPSIVAEKNVTKNVHICSMCIKTN
jgi:hypothetical protein